MKKKEKQVSSEQRQLCHGQSFDDKNAYPEARQPCQQYIESNGENGDQSEDQSTDNCVNGKLGQRRPPKLLRVPSINTSPRSQAGVQSRLPNPLPGPVPLATGSTGQGWSLARGIAGASSVASFRRSRVLDPTLSRIGYAVSRRKRIARMRTEPGDGIAEARVGPRSG
jgi:hypothetical protein